MGWDVSSGPGVTALGLAAARAVESGREDRLIEDPFARALFTAAGAGLPMVLDWPAEGAPVSEQEQLHLHGSRYIGVRTRHYDDFLRAAAADGTRQAVLLGAGLDTRAFRMYFPASLRLFEIDQADVLAYKDEVLSAEGARPRATRTALGVDLREDWGRALRGAGFDPAQRTAWVAEGLMPYLPHEARIDLLRTIDGLSASTSVLALDRITGDPAAAERLASLSERSGIDMQILVAEGESDELASWLRELGWDTKETPADQLARHYGRDLSNPFADEGTEAPAEPPWLNTVFVTATCTRSMLA